MAVTAIDRISAARFLFFSPIRNSINVDSLRRLPFALSSVQFAWFSW